MAQRKRIAVIGGAGAALLALSLWGFLRAGTAAELLPEPKPAQKPASAEAARAPEQGIVMKYDANQYIRTKPLQDPFRLNPAEGTVRPASPETPKSAASETVKAETADRPVLQGVIILGDDRRALIAAGGGTKTVKVGEQVGQWTVKEISGKQVVLSGPGGETVLSL